MNKIIKIFFGIYRYFISPALMLVVPSQCRYEETCSHYTERQMRERGFILGSYLGLKRILSCNPFNTKEEKYGS